jgi:hypothetical protein
MTRSQPEVDNLLALIGVWAKLSLSDARFWAFVGTTTGALFLAAWRIDLTPSLASSSALLWLLPTLPLQLQQSSLLVGARALWRHAPYWAFLVSTASIVLAHYSVCAALGLDFPLSVGSCLMWWGMVVAAQHLPVSRVSRSLALAFVAWFGPLWGTYSPIGVWIDVWPRPDRPTMVSLFLALAWLGLAASLALRPAPHEVRHSR